MLHNLFLLLPIDYYTVVLIIIIEFTMYSPILFIYGAIALGILWFVFKLFTNYQETHRDYAKKGDLGSQEQYANSKKEESMSMTLQERLDLSWQFLYDITNTILSKFSSIDKKQILELGQILFKKGMRYQHVVDYGIRQIDLKTQGKKDVKKDTYIE